MWKDFFYYTKTERRAVLLLIALILLAYGVYFSISTLSPKKTKNDPSFDKDVEAFMSSIRETKGYKYRNEEEYDDYSKRTIILKSFDPNTADSTSFLQLGLPAWMARNILRYRSKGGRFRKPEDFKKVYGLTAKQFETLLPYISIHEVKEERDTTKLLVQHKEKKDSIFKYAVGTIVDLNKADTTELKKIPGIGSYIAKLIINYRTKLGFFYSVEQLKDIHLAVDKVRSWFAVHDNETLQINLNRASLERLMRHPYFNFYQAKVIIDYRKKKGELKSLKQLSLYEEFTPTDFERLKHYVSF